MFRHHLGALALLALCALPLASSAQTLPAPGAVAPAPPAQQQRHHHRHNGYLQAMQSLHLSDAQKQQIAGFLKSARTANKGADRQTRRANMLAMRKQIDGVLSNDQRSQLRANLAREHRHEAKQTRPAPQGAAQ